MTDSRGKTSETIERLTIAPTFPPKIQVNDMTVTAEKREFDPLLESDIKVSDGIDEKPVLAVTNSNNKTTQIAVNVRIDIKYTLTVDYLDENGNKLAGSKEIVLNQGTEITENTLEIDGYNVDKSTITTILDKNKNIKFVYSEIVEPEIPTEPEIPVESETRVELEKPNTDKEETTKDKELEEHLYQTISSSYTVLKALIVSVMSVVSFGLIKFNLKKGKK